MNLVIPDPPSLKITILFWNSTFSGYIQTQRYQESPKTEFYDNQIIFWNWNSRISKARNDLSDNSMQHSLYITSH